MRRPRRGTSSRMRAASSRARSRACRPPTPLYCTLTQSPCATYPSLRTSSTETASAGTRTSPGYASPSRTAPALIAAWSSAKYPPAAGTASTSTIVSSPMEATDPNDLAELLRRRALTEDAARPDAVARRHAAGGRTARENVEDLIDPGSWVEYGRFAIAAQRKRRELADLIARTPADGLIAGTARVGGTPCAVLSYDYTVL